LISNSVRQHDMQCMSRRAKQGVDETPPPQVALPHKAAYLNPQAAADSSARHTLGWRKDHVPCQPYIAWQAISKGGDYRCCVPRQQRDDDLEMHQHAVWEANRQVRPCRNCTVSITVAVYVADVPLHSIIERLVHLIHLHATCTV
jgi:hypothetical protein